MEKIYPEGCTLNRKRQIRRKKYKVNGDLFCQRIRYHEILGAKATPLFDVGARALSCKHPYMYVDSLAAHLW